MELSNGSRDTEDKTGADVVTGDVVDGENRTGG